MRNASGQQGADSKVKMNASGKKKRKTKEQTGTQGLNTKSLVRTYDIFFFHKMREKKKKKKKERTGTQGLKTKSLVSIYDIFFFLKCCDRTK